MQNLQLTFKSRRDHLLTNKINSSKAVVPAIVAADHYATKFGRVTLFSKVVGVFEWTSALTHSNLSTLLTERTKIVDT